MVSSPVFCIIISVFLLVGMCKVFDYFVCLCSCFHRQQLNQVPFPIGINTQHQYGIQ